VRDGWKSNIVLWGNRYQAKKERIFLLGEVFFPLTPPLMGDPFIFTLPSSVLGLAAWLLKDQETR